MKVNNLSNIYWHQPNFMYGTVVHITFMLHVYSYIHIVILFKCQSTQCVLCHLLHIMLFVQKWKSWSWVSNLWGVLAGSAVFLRRQGVWFAGGCKLLSEGRVWAPVRRRTPRRLPRSRRTAERARVTRSRISLPTLRSSILVTSA